MRGTRPLRNSCTKAHGEAQMLRQDLVRVRRQTSATALDQMEARLASAARARRAGRPPPRDAADVRQGAASGGAPPASAARRCATMTSTVARTRSVRWNQCTCRTAPAGASPDRPRELSPNCLQNWGALAGTPEGGRGDRASTQPAVLTGEPTNWRASSPTYVCSAVSGSIPMRYRHSQTQAGQGCYPAVAHRLARLLHPSSPALDHLVPPLRGTTVAQRRMTTREWTRRSRTGSAACGGCWSTPPRRRMPTSWSCSRTPRRVRRSATPLRRRWSACRRFSREAPSFSSRPTGS